MLRSMVPKLICPTCKHGPELLRLYAFNELSTEIVRDGLLVCEHCRAGYSVEDQLLELVSRPLLYEKDYAEFLEKFSSRIEKISALSGSDRERKTGWYETGIYREQLRQRRHFDDYTDNGLQSWTDYQNMPFIQAIDSLIFSRWRALTEPGSLILDVGCANGRSSFPFAGGENTVIGFDISKKLVRQAIEHARSEGLTGSTTFFVADGSGIPFADESFDCVVTHGVLHHLPDPAATCRDIQRLLRKTGIHFAYENNKSVFRRIFDLVFKIYPLWREEAGKEPLISKGMIKEWTDGLPVRLTCSTVVFVPPHLCNLLRYRTSRTLLNLTNRLFSSLPFLKDHGGLIVCEIRKN